MPHARTAVLLLSLLALLLAAAPATASAPTRTVHFDGREVSVPASWPVYRLSERPRMCVRLDRRAVYLGTPGAEQRCPSEAMGKRRAILIEPARAARASATARASAPAAKAVPLASAGDYTGLGFDACTAPSAAAMKAWGASPYRAIGVYIGGLNRGCSQPNLTATWVRERILEGWSLIPTYVGLQAPTSSCGSCAKLTVGGARLQGAAAARDAVAQATNLGMGQGSPIYFDMESYARTSSATGATIAFLESWTLGLHEAGYQSGVYSSSSSGIADLAARVGTTSVLPDDLWIANWNGRQDTVDPNVPASAWSNHQRIHQYRGGHDERYGGVTINIDNNYVEGATVGALSSAAATPRGRLDAITSPLPGQVRVSGWAYDPALPTAIASIRVYVGGGAATKGAKLYDLGQVAMLERPDVGVAHRVAGPNHGFDVTFPVIASRRQRVCAYAVGVAGKASKGLGCRIIGVRPPLSVLRVRHFRGGARLALRCEWPVGVQCPGQLLVRARAWVGKGRRARRVRAVVARTKFLLDGGASGTFRVRLTPRGRQLLAGRARVRAGLTVAIPGSRLNRSIALRP